MNVAEKLRGNFKILFVPVLKRKVISFSLFHPLTLREVQVRKDWIGPYSGIPYLVEFTGESLPSPLTLIVSIVSSLKLTIAFQTVLFTLLRRILL
jgi:hypothetical protein